ncbi:unnamed protein product, partial [Didymodactylos carnosus]
MSVIPKNSGLSSPSISSRNPSYFHLDIKTSPITTPRLVSGPSIDIPVEIDDEDEQKWENVRFGRHRQSSVIQKKFKQFRQTSSAQLSTLAAVIIQAPRINSVLRQSTAVKDNLSGTNIAFDQNQEIQGQTLLHLA